MKNMLNGMPLWLKAIMTIGLPTVLVIYFLARDAGYIPSVATQTYALVIENNRQLVEHQKNVSAVVERIATGLRVICQNGARTDAERRNCDNIR